MRAVLQRVTNAKVTVEDRVTGEIGNGLVILLGVGVSDTETDVDLMANKIANLRIFADGEGKFNLSALETQAELLIVSQFTLYADCRKGRRPSFTDAAQPERAEALYEHFLRRAREQVRSVASGRFGARMALALVNDGPVTLLLDSAA